LPQGFLNIVFGFRLDMNRDRVCAGFDKTRDVMIGMLDHQVHIEWQFGLLAHKIDNRRAEGNVVDEMAVHDVAVNPIGACFFGGADLISQF
jgi:hypothetical protein